MLPNAHYNYVLRIFMTMSIFMWTRLLKLENVPISPISAAEDPGFARGRLNEDLGELKAGSKGRAPGEEAEIFVHFHTKSG